MPRQTFSRRRTTIHELGVEVYHTDRGGEATYHGPGQLVGYPILDLRAAGLGPLAYVRALERVIVSTLAELGIHATSEDRPTGVWVNDAKIAAIGVRVSRGVTMHGFALNVNSRPLLLQPHRPLRDARRKRNLHRRAGRCFWHP